LSEQNTIDPPDEPGADVSHKTLFVLEWLDSVAHVVVAIFFLVLSSSVLVVAAVEFVNTVHDTFLYRGEHLNSTFTHKSLEVLSTLLFAVIILELLRTIITYLQSHDIRAIMKEFLIVGIISSVRKILMIGAESSIGEKHVEATSIGGNAFVQESVGVVLSVLAILLLIGGLIALNKYYNHDDGHPPS
jgi:uncharacterized membrane protein (DUF373 family)